LLSLPPEARRFAYCVREHWSVENQLHWILDVEFREDQSRASLGHSAENLAVIRHLAVSLLSQDKSAKGGTHTKRLKAGWDERYPLKILAQTPNPSPKQKLETIVCVRPALQPRELMLLAKTRYRG
jgi:hypothetical protein